MNTTRNWILTALVAVFTTAVFVFAVLPQLPQVASGSPLSLSVLPALATGNHGDKPVCKSIDASPSTITAGESTTITWSTKNATNVKLSGGYNNVEKNGSRTAKPTKDTTYTLTVFNGDKQVTCDTKVTVKDTPTKELPVCKYLNAEPATIKKGESTILKWDTEHADQVVFNNGLGMVDQKGQLTVSPTKTTQYALWAKQDGTDKTGDCRVTVKVTEDTPTPTPSTCPYSPKKDRIILKFNERLLSNKDEATATSDTKNVTIPAGKYEVSLAANDSYKGRKNTTAQPNERWMLRVEDTTGTKVDSGSTPDLKDGVDSDFVQKKVNTESNPFVLAQDGKVAYGFHAVYPDTSSANSVNPICAALDPIKEDPKPETPVCPFTPKDGRIIVNFPEVTKGLLSNKGLDRAQKDPVNTTIPAGVYAVSLASFDNHDAKTQSQPNESYHVILKNAGGDTVATTEAISDLPDNVNTLSEKVQDDLNVSETVSSAIAFHAVYPDTSNANSIKPICAAFDPKPVDPAPVCTLTLDPAQITTGGSSNLVWTTDNTVSVSIDQGIGDVAEDGSVAVSPTANTIYTLTGTAANGATVTCDATLTVSAPDAPLCESFTATPGNLPTGGGDVVLAWETTNIDSVTIDNGVGTVAEDGNQTVNVVADTIFTLTATKGNQTATCEAPVTVAPVNNTLSCDSFRADPNVIKSGGSLDLEWETTGATKVTIDQGIGDVALDGSKSISATRDLVFTLTATDGVNEVQCNTRVTIDGGGGGGGGGGSSSPRCEFVASKTKIRAGEEITLSWDTVRTNDIIIEDSRGNILVDSDEDTSIDEDEGSIKVKPTRDTEYKLTAIRGSRDRECTVDIEIVDNVSVSSTRTQEPLVAGISLTSVPYTGFEAGPLLTTIFYSLIVLWGLGVAYMLVIRKEAVLGVSPTAQAMEEEEVIDAPVAVAPTVTPSTVEAVLPTPVEEAPVNLPTAEYNPVVGYAAVTTDTETENAEEEAAHALENRAHQEQILLSTDAIRFIIAQSTDTNEQFAMLDTIMDHAKATYPAEDGWVVVNKERIAKLFA